MVPISSTRQRRRHRLRPARRQPVRQPGAGRGNPNAGRTAAMVTMTGGRGPGMTGGPGYIRSGAVPYREPGSRKPEDALAVLLKAGANPNAKGPDGATLLHQAVNANNVAMIRALADAKVDFTQANRDGLTALDVAEGKQPANAPARARDPWPAASGSRRCAWPRRSRWCQSTGSRQGAA